MPRGKTGEITHKTFGISITNKKLQDKFEELGAKQKLSSTVQNVMIAYFNIREEA